MFYRLSLEVLGLRSHLKEIVKITFFLNGSRPTEIRLVKKYPKGEEPLDNTSAICIGTAAKDIADSQIASEFQTALTTSLDGIWANFRGMVDSSRVPLLWTVMDDVFVPLRNMMQATVTAVAWREGSLEIPADPFRNSKAECSLDGKNWLQVSQVRSVALVKILTPAQLAASIEFCNEIVELVETGAEEPLGHQLLREAWTQRESHPRSALAIGVSAAEVGLKQLIGGLVPQAQWLVDEIQMPSLSKMLRKFLPTLPVKLRFKGKSIRPPNVLIRRLEHAVECRNKLVHAGKAPPHRDDLKDMLLAVEDLLHICDVYAGHGWGLEHISAGTIAAWEDEKAQTDP
jgi:hypothetical protein